MKMVLGASEVAPIEVMLLILGTDEGCVTVMDPDIPVDPGGNCDELGAELGAELVGPANTEELDGGNNPDVDRAEGGTLVPGRPVDGVTAEPVKEISGVPELGLGLLIELVPIPADEVPSWLLAGTAPVFIDVSVGSEGGPSPVVRVATILETGLVTPGDDILPEMPDDTGIGIVSEPIIELENVGCGMVRLPLKVMTSGTEVLFGIPDDGDPVLTADKDCETEPGLVFVPSLVMPTDGKEVALVKFVRGYGPEVKVWLGMTEEPLLNPELVSRLTPLEAESKLPCEVRGEPVIETLPEVSSVLRDETNPEVTVELGIVKGGFVERGPDGTSEPPVVVVRTLPELNPVSDPDGTVPLGPGGAVELARVTGGITERGLVVVPMTVVGSAVSVVIAVMVDSTAAVIVVPVTVVGVIVNVSIEDETPVLFALAEFAGTDRLFVEVEFVTGYGAELDGCTDMAPELPLALVRLAPEEDSEIGGVPGEIGDVSVTIDVIDTPLGTVVGPMGLDELVAVTGGILDRGPVEPVPVLVSRPEVRKGGTVFVPKIDVAVMLDGDSVRPLVVAVELGNGKRPVEELLADPDAPVDSSGVVPEREPTVDSPGNPDVEPPTPIVAETEVVVIVSVEKLIPRVRLPLALTELRLSEDPGNVIENTPEPRLLGNPVGPTVATVELVIGNGPVLAVGYDPVPDTISLELLSGKGAVGKVLEKAVPEENAVRLLVVAILDDAAVDPRAVEMGALGKDPVMVEGGPVPIILLVSPTPSEVELLRGYGTVCELFCEVPMEVVICPDGFPAVDSVAETDRTLGLVSALVPVIEPPVGPTVGPEEFVMGNGVASLLMRELTSLGFVGDVMVNDSEVGIVKEPSPLNEVFVALADENDEFVIGKGVASVAPEDVPVRLAVEAISLPVRPVPDVTRVAVGTPELFVGLTTGTEEFVNGNGADSPAGSRVRQRGNNVVSVALREMPVVTGIEVDEPVNSGPVGPGAVIVVFERGYGTEVPVLLCAPLPGPPAPAPVIETELPVVPALALATEFVAVKDSSELEMVKPDDVRLKMPLGPADGNVKLPVPKVELVNRYGAVELDSDGCRLLLLLPVIKGGDVVPRIPLDSVSVVAKVVLLTNSVADVGVPGTVKLSVRAGVGVMPLRAVDVTLLSPED
ncbi:hypothetical protein F4782DRAFT_538273 [Xylaria castorea]|nr:hypothetical protein F4782DRAFT_538273 [Xylaria castorea]